MRWLPITACRSGMKLAKNVYSEEGLILLGEHVELNDSYIKRLKDMGVGFVYIEDKDTEGIEAPNLLSDQTRQEANYRIRKEFKSLMNKDLVKSRMGHSGLGKAFSSVLDQIIDDLDGHPEAMVMLGDIQATDDYIFRHSLNVCVYTTLFGLRYGYDREMLKQLSMGAMLHDIGKTQLNQKVLNKPGQLTDEEYQHVKLHTEYGFRILKGEPNIPLVVAHCAFQHHERLNGSGYPRGIKEIGIHEFAKWIAIADSYDAMTTHRVYRSALMPHEALEILYTGAGTLYDQSMLCLFRDSIAVYPLGMTVLLSTGETGVVARINPIYPQRPVIRLLTDPDGVPYADLREKDLSKSLNITILGAKFDG
ncbi:HD-GYP domain-containing protein [Paenibacillus sp. 1001270B_150601_E10]|uniref:HD-GYP domain-containing protein n=1 Tax=Paenibacillus sp. 1001270B_150601_E10 TaxID=2787079 RepID=UPI00189DA8BD|nr:HD-GYP domain-containing protein [Paenibacillus sp. 1001270B_150601_E10]